MLLNARGVVGALCLLPLAAATVLPREAGPNQLIRVRAPDVERRAPPIVIGDGDSTSTSSRSTSSASTVSTPASTSTPVSTPASTPTPTSTTSTPPPPTSSSTTTSRQVTSVISTTDGNGEPVTIFTTVDAPSSSTPSATAASSTNNNDSGPGKGTFIGLGVAGGIALLGLVGFIVWKMNQKRFSQFDDDGGDINWPMPKEELVPPAAPSTHAATNATNSSVDLTRDPYAVPPLPAAAMPYYDDPSGGAAYYDPYRGPVPHTFQSPPPSTEGHANTYAGEAIPMSTYPTSGRQSPGPNMIGGDPYARSGSPGPAVAYGDPYAAGRRSPGPAMAYGVPDPVGMRGGTPMGAPPRVGTPVGVGYGPGPGGPIPAGLDIPRTGTPQGGYAMGYGRASPAPPGAGYGPQAPLVDPYGRRTPGAYGP